jgi:hypothetical protein
LWFSLRLCLGLRLCLRLGLWFSERRGGGRWDRGRGWRSFWRGGPSGEGEFGGVWVVCEGVLCGLDQFSARADFP